MNEPITTVAAHVAQKITPLYSSYSQAYACAWWLIEWLTQKSQTQLRAQNYQLTPEQEKTLTSVLHEHIVEHKPLQYILGTLQFLDLTLTVKPPILIPRPETEYWCSELIAQLKQLEKQDFTILDMCSGSGCIGLAFAQVFPQARVYAVDILPQACDLVRDNAHKNNIKNIHVVESDLFAALPGDISFDIIISNPPYISHDEWLELDPSVKNWEDYRALVSPNNGLELITKLLSQSVKYIRLRPDFIEQSIPQIAIEIGYSQGTAVKEIFKHSNYTSIKVHKDLARHDRLVTAGAPVCI